MSKENISVWGRRFELEIVFDRYADEEVLPYQKEALEAFLGNLKMLDKAKPAVEAYCLDDEKNDEIKASKIENIFKYVIPTSIYVQRNKAERHIVGLMCNYKFDPEHGLAVVFEGEKLQNIGSQDIIL